jgi:class 3 adenylate cyclase
MKFASLSEWLKVHGLERFIEIFESNEVDLATLRILTDGDLKELGLPFGPRKQILNLLNEERALETRANLSEQVSTPGGERRQLTVLFCDLVGFTKLAYKHDPEALQIIIRTYEEACSACVNRYEGYVFRTLGDGIVAFFGFPLAHESEAERAIRAGLDIVNAMTQLRVAKAGRLQVRIGIASGVVIVAPGERNAMGEALNLAARLQTIAEPGSIVVSDRVRRLAGGEFQYEDLGEKDLKGVTGLTRVYQVLGVSRAESRFEAAARRGLTPLVGRERELSTLIDSWRQVRETEAGRAILLRGEAGIGKSRIVSDLRERLREETTFTQLFQCSPFFVNSAFHPIRASFERTLAFNRDLDAEETLDKIEALVVDRLGLPREDMRLIAALLSLPYQERYGAIVVSPKLAKDETMRVLIEFVRARANAGPTLIVLEDAHWADPTTLELLGRFIDRLANIPVLFILTGRTEFNAPFLTNPTVGVVELSKFTPAQSTSLVDNLLGGKSLPNGLAAQIIARTDGVPLFVEELTKAVLETGNLVVEGDHYAYAKSAAIVLPETLRDSLMARLDRAPLSKEIAQVGSVIGREFSYELIAGLDLMSEEALGKGLQHLTESGLATCRGEIPSAVYTFSHVLVQDAAYDSLLKSRRKQLHNSIARLLDERRLTTRETAPELLAFHYTAAEQYRVAAPLWLEAGEAAIARFAMSEAVAHLRTGLSAISKVRPSNQRDRIELSLRTALGPAVVAHRGWGQAEVSEVLEPAWRLAQSLRQNAAYLPILNALAVHNMCMNQQAESLRWADQLLRAGAELTDERLEIVGHRAASATHFWLGKFAAARRSGDKVHVFYDPERHWDLVSLTNTDPLTGEGIYRSQFLWIMGYPDQAVAANQATEANARRRGHPFDLAFALTLGAQLFDFLSDPDALLQRTEEAERVSQEHGIALLGEIMAEISRGVAWLRAGRLREAATQLDRGTERLMQTGHRIWIWYLRALRAEALALAGDLDAAWSLIDESVTRIEAGEERSHYAEVMRLKGWILMLRGEPDWAASTLHSALTVARQQKAKSWELRCAITLAKLLASRGEPDSALELLAPIYSWFTEGRDTKDLQQAARLIESLRSAER